MSESVEVPFGDDPSETATLLLAAAVELDLDPAVEVRTTSEGMFVVSEEVAKKAKLKGDKVEPDPEPPSVDDTIVEETEQPKPAKKTTAKKTAAKKTAKAKE